MHNSAKSPELKQWLTPVIHDLDSDASDIANGMGPLVDAFNGRSTPTAS